ncbi:MAG: dihydroneopterin aldolase [Alphaproteobacteria bacterium GM202ARS2]|nr:dihydroneopterin aldolase [Alphaproteobacteria bacterium GM202ARS2]
MALKAAKTEKVASPMKAQEQSGARDVARVFSLMSQGYGLREGFSVGAGLLPDGYYRVFIRDLTCQTCIGIHDYERDVPQRLVINLWLLARDARDDFGDTQDDVVCYEGIKESFLRHIASKAHWSLVEGLANQLLDLVMADERVFCATLSLEKPDIFDDCGSVGIELSRRR